MTNFILQTAIASKINQLGLGWIKLQSLSLNSPQHRLLASVQLAGESQPLNITADYVVRDQCLHLTKLATDRAWMNAALETFVLGKLPSFPLPEGFLGKVASFFLG